MRRGIVGAAAVLAAATAWVTLILAARIGDADSYAVLAGVWSIYYAALGLTAGIQQELTLRSLSTDVGTGRPVSAGVVVVALPILVGLAAVTSTTDVASSGGTTGVCSALLAVLALIGGTGLVLALGQLAVERRSTTQAALLVIDAGARFVAVLAVVGTGLDVVSLWGGLAVSAWVWLPWGWRGFRDAVRQRAQLLPFVRGALLLMASAAGSSVLLAGMPVLVVLLAPPGTASPGLLVALVLLRSPLMVLVLAYRPSLLSRWAASTDLRRTERRIIRTGVITAALAGAVAWLLGPSLVGLVAGAGFGLGQRTAAGLVASGVLMGVAVVTTMARAADGNSAAASAAWLAAVASTVLVLVLGPEGGVTVAWACLAGPSVVLAWALLPGQSRPREKADSRSWRE